MVTDIQGIREIPNISPKANQCFMDKGQGMCTAPAFGVIPEKNMSIDIGFDPLARKP